MSESAAIARLREGTEVLRTGGGGANLTARECNQILDALEAAEDFIFGAHRPGDITPLRAVQASFATLGLRSQPDA